MTAPIERQDEGNEVRGAEITIEDCINSCLINIHIRIC